MTTSEFLSDNFVMIYEIGGLVILLLVGAHISLYMKRKTLVAIGLLVTETICYLTERWTQTYSELSILRPMLTATLYSIYPLIIIVMMLVTTTEMDRKRFWLLMIPELVCIPVFYTSQWTHIVFYFINPNNYQGGPLSYLPYALFTLYVVIFLIHNFIYLRHTSRINRTIVAYITIGPLVGAFAIMILGIDKDYCALFTSGFLLYFAYLYIHMAKVDPLTSLYNRQSYYQDIEVNARYITCVVSVDMNDLKYLNDNFGHQAGDVALKTVAQILRGNCGRNATVYRVGGDEFMIFYTGSTEETVKKDLAAMKAAMDKTEYVCAYGYAMVDKGRAIPDAIRISDQRMYDNKAELKKIRNLNATGLRG
ncbi:GGDEF domain-containing protein [Butyrivibrio sp. AE2032]|uniref:GGDEF domain-containing protein n=1 Tax=Butyrivibrio sp. AE2032 TaxID=1458463 RepID=UPI0005585EAB|nr:GGDEF domain-containing protein [Butyrivibrio sp. AE2032]